MESNKLTVRYHEISVDFLNSMKKQLKVDQIDLKNEMNSLDGPVFIWNQENEKNIQTSYRAPGMYYFWLEIQSFDV